MSRELRSKEMRNNDGLSDEVVENILGRIPSLTIGVLGDLFLDRYLELDAALTEPSLETGLDAYQVVRVRSVPGAAGTVINNLVALGVGRVCPIAVIGDDGEGYELRQALRAQRVVDPGQIVATSERRTPTYTKPMLHVSGKPARELNRLDIKNRQPLPGRLEQQVLHSLDEVWPQVDALVVLDQVSEPDCGVVTALLRQRLGELGDAQPDKLILADSRARIGLFRSVSVKPNRTECRAATGTEALESSAWQLARQVGRTVFCTLGEQGILVTDPHRDCAAASRVPAYPVNGPIDPVGAGDSSSAAIVCAAAAETTPEQAAAFGNLVASITIQQIGTTGTASPEQVRQRSREVADGRMKDEKKR
jgi:bifunctional ADP-heptose synthase (sugar kinase/adenylyltransferase)